MSRLPDDVLDGLSRFDTKANPTEYIELQSAPLGIPIETKANGGDAYKQLSVWAFALFAHLRSEFGAAPDFLPLIHVNGPSWELCIATQENRPTPLGSHKGPTQLTTVIHNGLNFGNSTEPAGVYQIVATLSYLFEWVGTKYFTWFEGQVKAAVERARQRERGSSH